MDGRNGSVVFTHGRNVYVRLPDELFWLINRYQIEHRFNSISTTLRHLLETHQDLLQLLHDMNNPP